MKLIQIVISPGHDYWVRHGEPTLQHGSQCQLEITCKAGRGLIRDRYYLGKPNHRGQITFMDQSDKRAALVQPIRPVVIRLTSLIVEWHLLLRQTCVLINQPFGEFQMFFDEWVYSEWGELGMVLVSAIVTYAAIILFTRLAGLRSFSKMSAADFAMTVAVGSLFASTVSSAKPTLIIGLFSLALLFLAQWLVATLREKVGWFSKAVDNQPLLLMAGGKILHENLRRANVTEADIFGKLREANALNYDQIRAVVFETTGDISVLHSSDSQIELEADFLRGVVGAERLFNSQVED